MMAKTKIGTSSVRSKEIVDLPQIVELGRGTVGVAECGTSVPFVIARAFYLYDLPANAVRGEHAHRESHQFVICLAGAVKASLWDRDGKRSLDLASPAVGLYVPPMTWLRLENGSPETICLVLASTAYDEADYIRDAKAFKAILNSART
jgi:hypothetical protein